MLVFSRKIGEKIIVPEYDLVVTILELTGSRVRVGLEAPQSVKLYRKEIWDRDPSRNKKDLAWDDS